jgi:hypothetical protein
MRELTEMRAFTAEEYLKSIADSASEMSDEQLRRVSGGAWEPTVYNIFGSIVTFGVGCAAVAIASAVQQGDADKCHFEAPKPSNSPGVKIL